MCGVTCASWGPVAEQPGVSAQTIEWAEHGAPSLLTYLRLCDFHNQGSKFTGDSRK